MTEEIKGEIIYQFRTQSGPLDLGLQFDLGSHKSNIICVPCQKQNRLTTSKNIREHARHVIREHPEILEK